MDHNFPIISSRKYPGVLSIKVDLETKALYRFVKDHGFDAAEIFRSNGRHGLEQAKAYINSKEKPSDRSA